MSSIMRNGLGKKGFVRVSNEDSVVMNDSGSEVELLDVTELNSSDGGKIKRSRRRSSDGCCCGCCVSFYLLLLTMLLAVITIFTLYLSYDIKLMKEEMSSLNTELDSIKKDYSTLKASCHEQATNHTAWLSALSKLLDTHSSSIAAIVKEDKTHEAQLHQFSNALQNRSKEITALKQATSQFDTNQMKRVNASLSALAAFSSEVSNIHTSMAELGSKMEGLASEVVSTKKYCNDFGTNIDTLTETTGDIKDDISVIKSQAKKRVESVDSQLNTLLQLTANNSRSLSALQDSFNATLIEYLQTRTESTKMDISKLKTELSKLQGPLDNIMDRLNNLTASASIQDTTTDSSNDSDEVDTGPDADTGSNDANTGPDNDNTGSNDVNTGPDDASTPQPTSKTSVNSTDSNTNSMGSDDDNTKDSDSTKGPDDGSKGPDDGSKPRPDDESKPGPDDESKPGPDDGSKPGPDDESKPGPDDESKPGPDDGSKGPDDGSKGPGDGSKGPGDGSKGPSDGSKGPDDNVTGSINGTVDIDDLIDGLTNSTGQSSVNVTNNTHLIDTPSESHNMTTPSSIATPSNDSIVNDNTTILSQDDSDYDMDNMGVADSDTMGESPEETKPVDKAAALRQFLKMFDKLDMNDDGFITFTEFSDYFPGYTNAFNYMDKNRDGSITRAEIFAAINSSKSDDTANDDATIPPHYE